MINLQRQFFEKGQKLEVEGNHHFSLKEKNRVWFLEKGSLNLFAIDYKQGVAEGPRTLIASFTGPSVLFEMDLDTTYEILAITEKKSTLWKTNFQEIEQHLHQEPQPIANWVNSLADIYKKHPSEEIQTYIEPPERATLEEQHSLALKRAVKPDQKNKISWVKVQEGEVEFLGISSLVLNAQQPLFPLTYHAWLKGKKAATLQAFEHTTEWREGLCQFHRTFFDYFIFQKEKADQELAESTFLRQQSEEKNVHHSFLEMASVLNSIESLEFYGGIDPLFLACQKIGEFQKIKFKMPDQLPETEDVEECISAISKYSKVRYRRVALKGKWWKLDSGPLLAFYTQAYKPVALVRSKSNTYSMIDPETGQKTTLNQTLVKELAPFGYMFYTPFPEKLKTGREMIGFYLRQNSYEFIPLILYSILAALLSLFPPFATEILFDKVIPDTNFPLLWQIAIGLLIAALSASLFIFFRSLIVARIEGKSSNQIQSALWDRLLRLPVSFFRRYSTGNLILRVMSTEQMRALLSGNATRVLFSGTFSLFYILAMSFYAPALTLIAIGVIFLSFLVAAICAVIYARYEKQVFEVQGEINAFVVQIISSVGKLRTVGAEKNAFSKWAEQYAKSRKLILASGNVRNVVKAVNYVLPYTLYLLIFGYVIINDIHYTIGTFLAFNTAFISFYLAMTDLSNTAFKMVPIFPLWKRTQVIVQEPVEEASNKEAPGSLLGEVSLDEVFFRYAENEPLILNKVSLSISPKEFVGIVGPSGSGKSTLLRLLLGFETPHSGGIYFDGKDLSALSIHQVRKQMGVVLQEEGIVAGSILENLICGGRYPPEQIQEALTVSGFGEDIESFPMGVHTYLSMGGSTLSGGQKQRLLIARALLPHPKILLLDEATSALDNKNQERVIKSITKLDVTRVVIAHRLSTVRNADRIYVIEQGEIVQSGTFEALSAQEGLFAKMLKRQNL